MRTAIYSPKSWHARLYLRKYNDLDTDICTYSRRVFTIVLIRVLLVGLVVSMSLSAYWYLNTKYQLGLPTLVHLNEEGKFVGDSPFVTVVFFLGLLGMVGVVTIGGTCVILGTLSALYMFVTSAIDKCAKDTFMKDSRDSFFKRMCFRVTFKE